MDITHTLKKTTTGRWCVGRRRGGHFGTGYRHCPGRPSVSRSISVVPRATVTDGHWVPGHACGVEQQCLPHILEDHPRAGQCSRE
jgi:hypothetical protein